MLAVAAAAAIGSSTVGTVLGVHIDAATGPVIVVIQAVVCPGALLWSKRPTSVPAPISARH